mmetsp:Transcript_10824/g.16115  ORF Transcript_10824/g.16115 Transcript_10824/m.16115 type:complete len:215 (+) Transcript_10824:93-737(+)|eukprot:CAMPEP_0196802810 /NCGR_PEP_ID=MMETSP1362-20130617/2365_1 /TAXON_ID=163516 /ORGANISM="Leptocylindrus danicus, Strain CCMP1856" /LENGTH=214 /DNA_ID=CAMNT_0042174211 /DNA_START=74 /DNA_END=718 /DNA_ORIENTATION=+
MGWRRKSNKHEVKSTAEAKQPVVEAPAVEIAKQPVETKMPQPEKPVAAVAAPKQKKSSKEKGKKSRYQVMKEAPSARDAAFGGPPRYDWIDVETAAAIKVQSKFRQLRVQRELEAAGLTTSAQRNRIRQRESKQNKAKQSEDIPFLFSMCGIGHLFGHYDEDAIEAQEKAEKEEKRRMEESRMEAEREARFRTFHAKNRERKELLESLEVVEDV